MAFEGGDYYCASTALELAFDRYIERGDERGIATASFVAPGVIAALRHPGEGEDVLRQAVDRFRQLEDRWGLAFGLLALGTILLHAHREVDEMAPLEEGAQIARQGGEGILLSNALIALGWAYLGRGDVNAAGQRLGEFLIVPWRWPTGRPRPRAGTCWPQWPSRQGTPVTVRRSSVRPTACAAQ